MSGLSHWRTTAIGAVLAVLYYLNNVGATIPTTRTEWFHFIVGALVAGLGYVAADSGLIPKPTNLGGNGAKGLPPGPVLKAIALLTITAFALSACGTTLKKLEVDLAKITGADLDQALVLAQAATDSGAPYRARCYATLKKHVPADQTVGQALPAIKGRVSAYEQAAQVDAKLRSGLSALVPPDVHADCAVLLVDIQEFAVRLGARILPGAR